ncbi:MAG: hypothetical protein QOI30_3551 [Mycobacterium sp.]|nr:hypothetical protein [Mycobacterium sp.]
MTRTPALPPSNAPSRSMTGKHRRGRPPEPLQDLLKGDPSLLGSSPDLQGGRGVGRRSNLGRVRDVEGTCCSGELAISFPLSQGCRLCPPCEYPRLIGLLLKSALQSWRAFVLPFVTLASDRTSPPEPKLARSAASVTCRATGYTCFETNLRESQMWSISRHPQGRHPTSRAAGLVDAVGEDGFVSAGWGGGEQTATGSGSSAYTSRTALLTKRSAVRSTTLSVTKRA